MELTGNWSYPTSIRFGAGRIAELAAACAEAGTATPLLVTDRILAKLDMTKGALALLEEAGLGGALFCDVDANPTGANLAAGLDVYRAGGHDGVVAFGGGSALDLGKVLAFMSGQTRPVWDFEDIGDYWKRADSAAIDPIVAVPTTAGTGSEVGRAAVITDTDINVKKIIFHPLMLPKTVICDPQLSVGMPPPITAGTGMDALAHCLEAYCSAHYHPLSQGIALEGMRLVKENLLQAYRHGDDLRARAHMMAAAAMGAIAFQKGLGAIHALSHPIGALYHTHHGTTNAVVMPAVLRFNRPAIEGLIERAAAYLEIAGGFEGFLGFVGELNDALSIPRTLSALGVRDAPMDRLVTAALSDPTASGNPIEMTRQNTADLYAACM